MVIETKRLILREYTPDDLPAIYEILSDPETMQHYPAPYDEATTKRWDYKLMDEDITKTYYYKVRAYKNSNGKRVYSEYSDPVKVAP